MKRVYGVYYRLTEDDLREACKDAYIVFDTNTLLDPLRLSPALADKTIRAIEKYKERIRIPAHVDKEYHRHFIEVPAQVLSVVEEKRRALSFDTIYAYFDELFKGGNSGCSFPKDCKERYVDMMRRTFARIRKDMDKLEEYYNENFRSHKLQLRISELLEDSVLPGFGEDELKAIAEEGAGRYAAKIPPGYKDGKKSDGENDNNQYGDLIIWKEIIRLASGKKGKNVIFVCGDVKEDWKAKVAGKVIGPRIELLEEFSRETGGKIFHIYTLEQFLRVFAEDDFTQEELSIISMPSRHVYENIVKGINNIFDFAFETKPKEPDSDSDKIQEDKPRGENDDKDDSKRDDIF